MHPQRAAAVLFLATSAAYLALASGIETVATSPAATIGPRGFPILVGALGTITSLFLLLAPRPASERPSSATLSAGDRRDGIFHGDWRRVLALCALALLYAVALPNLGFTLATTAFLAVAFRLLGERRIRTLVVVPLAIAVFLLAVLRGALDVYLPEPILEAVLRSIPPSP
jgi:hypothetical protein